MAGFPDAFIAELLSKNDIASVIGSYIALKPKGRRMWGLCPFHGEKTASFSVSLDRQLYYCFGCHAGGSVVQFVMEMEKLSYFEAVKFLAQRVNMALPDEIDDAALQKERALKERLYAACKDAARFFFERLAADDAKPARAYLASRGLDAAVVKRFGIGWAGDSGDELTRALLQKGFLEQELILAGLSRKKGERLCDVFRGRIIFPIISLTNRVIGFGARALGAVSPKYLNTGETPIFNKRAHLFGLHLAKREKLTDIVLVEGYMDVVSLVQHGVTNAAASLGTALTAQQARLLRRLTDVVYIAFDGDAAGQAAMLKGMDALAREGIDVRVIVFPDEQDPDEYVKEKGRIGFFKLKDDAFLLHEFKLNCMKRRYHIVAAEGAEGYAIEACALIATLEPVQRERYLSDLSQETNLPLDALKMQLNQTSGAPKTNRLTAYRSTREKTQAYISLRRQKIEKKLFALLVADRSAADEIERTGIVFRQESFGRFAEALLKGQTPDPAAILAGLSPSDAEECSAVLMEPADDGRDIQTQLAECIKSLKVEELTDSLHALEMELKLETQRQKQLELLKAIQAINKELMACAENK